MVGVVVVGVVVVGVVVVGVVVVGVVVVGVVVVCVVTQLLSVKSAPSGQEQILPPATSQMSPEAKS